MQTLLIEILLLLPFVSGVAVLHIIVTKRKLTLSLRDKIVSGAILGNFMLVAPSILVGFISDCLIVLFEIYTLLSLSVIVLCLFYILSRKKVHLSFNIRLTGLRTHAIYLAPILLFALFVLFFHTLYLEYDAIQLFFPYAQSIASTGSMKYSIYDQTRLSTGMPPVLPVIYAWAFTAIEDLSKIGIHNNLGLHDLLRPIPTAYFLLTALVTYLITQEILQGHVEKKHALVSVIIFMSFPCTILTQAAATYYLDLGFVFYLVSTLLFMIKGLRTRKSMWFLFAGIASSLFLLVKELSVFVLPLIFAIFILWSSISYRRGIFAILSTLPFYVVFLWDLYAFPMSEHGWILMRQLPVFALSAILYYMSRTIKRSDGLVTCKSFVLFAVPFIPSAVFLLRCIVFLGSLYSIWGPAFSKAIGLFQTATVISSARDVAGFFRWDGPFLSLGVGALYLIPILISIACFLGRRYHEEKMVSVFVLMMFFTLLETTSFTLVGSQMESRRMYYFVPILAVLATKGLMLFKDSTRSESFIYLFALLNSAALSYIWLYRLPFQTMLGLSYLHMSLGLANVLDLVFFSLLFAVVFLGLPYAQKKLRIGGQGYSRLRIEPRKRVVAVPVELENVMIKDSASSEEGVPTRRRVPTTSIEHKKRQLQNPWSPNAIFRSRERIVFLSLLTLSCSMVVYPTIPIWIQVADRDFSFFSFQHDVHETTWENGILFVGYYYSNYIDDHHVTVSFGGSALRYFTNRSIIDLSTVIGVQPMQDILTIQTPEDLLQALNSSNIRYFLIPRSNNSFYDLYEGFRDNFYLFSFVEQDTQSTLIQVFTHYTLYRIEYS